MAAANHSSDPTSYRISNNVFGVTLLVAIAVHLVAILIYTLSPKMEALDVPVRVLNIKLGGEQLTQAQIQKAFPQAPNQQKVEATVSDLLKPTPKATPKKKTSKKIKPKRVKLPAPVVEKELELPKNYVRETNPQQTQGQEQGLDYLATTELIARYEQTISLWIQKFKIYPESARSQKTIGETMVRIRIDRRGNIVYYALERSTGSLPLDRAAIDMIRRANPVPPIPVEYPQGDLFEFLIPVNFQLQ